ncbi:MAG: hypothetical protein M3552_21575 [Planctomycetota bacterium]|nr:hypothetical protein [Planctomycetaceae bacterium]MDQ3333204.1 hypothetical protein [Planctomycetota bacterium]
MNENTTGSPDTAAPLSGAKAAATIVFGLIAIILLAAAMPARVKLLGLFPVAFAALIGYVFGRVAMLAGLRRRGVLVPLTTIVVAAGLAGYYTESFRRWRAEREQYYADHIGRQPGGKQILQRLQGNMLSADPLMRQFDDPYRSLLYPSFTEYLDQRVASLRIAGRNIRVASPWPLVLFAAELMIGTVAGLSASLAASRRSRTPTTGKVTA